MKIKSIVVLSIFCINALAWFNQDAIAQAPVLFDITDFGGAISAQYNDSPSGEAIDKVIDNTTSTKYLTFHAVGWIQYASNDLYVVTEYSISSANDAAERDPKDWTLKGSNDLTTWTVLDARTNEDFPSRFQTKLYTFTNTNAYLYYRLEMNNNSTTLLQLSEWALFGTSVEDQSGVVPTVPDNLSGTSNSFDRIELSWKDNSDNEAIFRIEKSMDGNNWTTIATVGLNIIKYTVTGLLDSTAYHFRVYAANKTGNSGYSNVAKITTRAIPQDPPYTGKDLTEPAWMNFISPKIIKTPDFIKSEKIFNDTTIATVHITMSQTDYDRLLTNTTSDEYLFAKMTYSSALIPGETVDSVGIRLRGAAVRNSNKKAFKISFREFGHDDREFHGMRKLNLNSDFQDPNLMRSKISTDLFTRMGVPAARTGYAKLYINNIYRGIFVNYEECDKAFLKSRFGENAGNLYKGNGNSTMVYRADGNYQGTAYELSTNEELNDYSDLAHFIDVLNNTPDANFPVEIKKVLEVDEILMYAACNVLLGAWDDYWYIGKNFYFYHNLNTGKFEYIPHDFDGSLGTDWAYGPITTGNVYAWGKSPRPLIERLLTVPEFKKQYTYYLLVLYNWAFSLKVMEPSIERTKSLIRQTVMNDPFWAADFDRVKSDFDDSFVKAISHGNVKFGLQEYIQLRRTSALNQLIDYSPFINYVHGSFVPDANKAITVRAFIIDNNSINNTKLTIRMNGTTTDLIMYDDGTHGDEVSNDGMYTAQATVENNTDSVKYHISSTDNLGKITRYPSGTDWLVSPVGKPVPQLFINEIMADNETVIPDEQGNYGDWFELFNNEAHDVDLTGMYVTDNLSNSKKWKLPNLIIPTKGFLIIWADSDTTQGKNHVGFSLSKSGEAIGLFDSDKNFNQLIDSVTFKEQQENISYGRETDGTLVWQHFFTPTPGSSNIIITTISPAVKPETNNFKLYQNYPNPFHQTTSIPFDVVKKCIVKIDVYNLQGTLMKNLVDNTYEPGNYNVTVTAKGLTPGMYYYVYRASHHTEVNKMMVLE
jgi:spore coat protein CotH